MQEWFRLRREAEGFYGITVEEEACPRGGAYIPMKLELASLGGGKTFARMPVPDTSPDVITPPFPESRYLPGTTEWDNFVGGHKPGGAKNKGKKKGKKEGKKGKD